MKILVPDLHYWAEKIIKNCNLNKNITPLPITFADCNLSDSTSFIRLLFDENWPKDNISYGYNYILLQSLLSIPTVLRTRLKLYPLDGRCYILSDSTNAENLFELEEDDFLLLDKLLIYKLSDTTGVTINNIQYPLYDKESYPYPKMPPALVDSTTEINFDPNFSTEKLNEINENSLHPPSIIFYSELVNLLDGINFNNLSTPLSKLIYIYLKLQISGDYTLFDTEVSYTDSDNILTNFYELYLADLIFTFVSNLGDKNRNIYSS